MSELKVLSKEEVDALLNLNAESELGAVANEVHEGSTLTEPESEGTINQKALRNISDLTASECEKILTSFLRKKIHVEFKSTRQGKLSECLEGKTEKHVFTIFRAKPANQYGMASMNMPLLHHSINLLFGGQFNASEAIMEAPGKIGIIIADKLIDLCLHAFAKGSADYGEVKFETIKTITTPTLTSKMSLDDQVCAIEMTISMAEVETTLEFMFADSFIKNFIPSNPKDAKHVEGNHWRAAIESQVVDSYVTLNVALPDVSLKVKDILSMKEGDIIPIGDPTLVYVCLNNLKLFKATAGQANSKRVAKILSEV